MNTSKIYVRPLMKFLREYIIAIKIRTVINEYFEK